MELQATALSHRLVTDEGGYRKIKSFFDRINENIEHCSTYKIDGVDYYIANIEKINTVESQYYYLFTVSRADTHEPIIISDTIKPITEREEPLKKTEEQGLTNKARFIYSPFYNVIIQHRNREKVNLSVLREYIKKCVLINTLEFDIVLQSNIFDKFDEMELVNKVSYSVANPTNISLMSSKDDDEFYDLKQFDSLDAERYSIDIFGKSLNKDNLLNRIKFLIRKNQDEVFNVGKIEVIGNRHGEEEVLDLIKHKLKYKGFIRYSEPRNDDDYFAFLNNAYLNMKSELSILFKIMTYEDEE